jgi:hypothetical protein
MRKLLVTAISLFMLTNAATADPEFIESLASKQLSAGQLRGTRVYLRDSSRECQVDDLLFHIHSLYTIGYVIFCPSNSLYQEPRTVALDPRHFSWITYDGKSALKVHVTHEQLLKAKEFKKK